MLNLPFSLQLFQGNLDRFSIVAHDLAPPIRARFVRFHVKKYRSFPALRVEIYGCYYGGGKWKHNMIKIMEIQKKSAIFRFCVGLGLCYVKLHDGIAFGTSFYWLSQGCPENCFKICSL